MFKMKEYCSQLVDLASDTGNAAWTERTSPSSTYQTPDLNFRYISDYAPFAMSVVPNPLVPPSLWGGKVRPEAPNLRLAPPHQVRSGGPYACLSNAVPAIVMLVPAPARVRPVTTSSDCEDAENNQNGICISGGVCLKYDSASKNYQTFNSSKKACKTNAACNAGEECVGGAAADRGLQAFVAGAAPAGSATGANQYFAQYRLQRLFAESFSIWEWSDANYTYVDVSDDPGKENWSPPTRVCQSCSGGVQGGNACQSATPTTPQCPGTGITCTTASRHPKANSTAGAPDTADYCAIKPTITNIIDLNDSSNPANADVNLNEGSKYILKFNSNVDIEQRPLRRITIDWGDGRATQLRTRIAPRDDPSNPHIYFHPYHCESGSCDFTIRIQIQDNWGWCSDGNPCSLKADPNPGTAGEAGEWIEGPKIHVNRAV